MFEQDPFIVKKYSKWNPKRVLPTLYARLIDYISQLRYSQYALPTRRLSELPKAPEADWHDTSVTPKQMRYLLRGCEYTSTGACIEVGSYRGVTTRCLGQRSHPRSYYAVDPYIGYGGVEEDRRLFLERTAHLSNVTHLEKTSGEAAREWMEERGIEVSFVFVDAIHNYWNTRYDLREWGKLLSSGGILAAHDTDQKRFAGTRRAVYEQVDEGYSLFSHIENLTLL